MNIEQPAEFQDYLRQAGYLADDESVEFEVLAGGVSNRTVLVHRKAGPSWVVKQSLSKLRVEADWYCDPARIRREAAGLRTLQTLLKPGDVPQYVFEDAKHYLFAMSAIAKPHDNWKQLLLTGQIDEQLIRRSGDMLAAIHMESASRHALLQSEFSDRLFFESLRLEPYYAYTAQQVPDASLFLNRLIDQTRSTVQTLVHGDYSPKNILVRDNRLVLLDYEVVHWGDPSFDCGFFLTHLISKSHHLHTQREAFLSAAKLWMRHYLASVYEQLWAEELEARVVRQTLGCLLARVRGRSPLEYLSETERDRQAAAVVKIMNRDCWTIAELCQHFEELIT